VEPEFPIPPKSKNHHNFLPIGLLKIASYLRTQNVDIMLLRGIPSGERQIQMLKSFSPEEVWITTLFTYWADYVRDTVRAYKCLLPDAKVVLGGILASLLPPQVVIEYTGCDEVHVGVVEEAEKLKPAYDLLEENGVPINYQILHTSRGCQRKCAFCGTWKVEPEFKPLSTIRDKVFMKRLVFYDNNFLMNPHVEKILHELIELRAERRVLWCESQSGFDGRVLLKNPELARLLKEAGFRNPRIAWDGGLAEKDAIWKQLLLLKDAGYELSKEVYVFMLYNWEIPFEELEAKRIQCWEWRVQIADCRYRPLDQLYDNYDPRRPQTSNDYHIHVDGGWTDALVKQFRRNVREQNICVRHGFPFYSRHLERKKNPGGGAKERARQPVDEQLRVFAKKGVDCWVPNQPRYPR